MKRPLASLTRWRLSAALVLGLLLTGLYPMMVPTVSADPVGPSARDKNIAYTVSLLLKKYHLTKHPFDQEIYTRALSQFYKMLDPMKLYFYQSDIDKFAARQKEVDLIERRGDVTLAHDIFRTFLSRVDERMKMATEILAMPHDFTVDEEMTTDRDALKFSKDEKEAFERWRKRIKYDLLALRADRIDENKKDKADKKAEEPSKPLTPEEQAKADLEKLKRRYHSIGARWHQTDGDDLLEMYLTAVSNAFDPHTSYMSPETVENFNIQMRLELEGIGAELRSEDGETLVNKLVTGGAAAKQGQLKVGDKIMAVGQNGDGPMQDVVEMKLPDVVKLIRGKRGTVVRLEIVSRGSKERKIIQITRDRVELKDSEARAKIFEEGRKPNGQPYQIGMIDLPSFYMDMEGASLGLPNYRSTTRDVRKILQDFNRKGVDALVLDLRKNGGGSLQEAINLTGLFVGDGPVVQVKDAEGRVNQYNDDDASIAWKGPMVVLISKFSASASEILAGAIQDYHRGLIIGDHSTHGKGTVQSLDDLSKNLFGTTSQKMGALKITMQKFYRPSGDSTQRRGVLADLEIPSLTTHMDVGEADLDYPVPFDQVDAKPFKAFSLVSKGIADRLSQLSIERRRNSTDFQQLLKQITRYEEQKKRKRVTLNEQKFLAERAEWNTGKEEEKKLEEMAESGNTEIKRNYYLNEALAITADYLNLVNHREVATPQAAQAAREPAPALQGARQDN